jgi:small conductance mechanosensitive channel
MEDQINRLRVFLDLLLANGPRMLIGLIILFLGVFFTKWLIKKLNTRLSGFIKNPATRSVIVNTVGVLLYAVVVAGSLIQVGANPARVIALIMFVSVGVIGIVVVFRPLLPSLPFKAGDVVKTGTLLGRVEGTTILNTRLRTFDGKTFFVPNKSILNDVIINYYYTKTRRVKINVTVGYDQDLLKTKQALEAVMTGDARVLVKPSPQVYVLNLTLNGIEVGARCWVENKNLWMTKCDLTEKIKYRFDQEGIAFAYNKLDVQYQKKSTVSRSGTLDEEQAYQLNSPEI